MYYLKDTICERCGGLIIIDPYYDKESRETVVNCGICEQCMKGVVLPTENYEEFCKQHGYTITKEKKILECSSKGDKRFSAFYAKVEVFGVTDSIENHYQKSKSFNGVQYEDWKDAKGKTPTGLRIKVKDYDVKYLSMWYKLLWLKYLDSHPELVTYAKGFDDFHDMFKGKSLNCQADVIKQYIQEGRQSIINDCKEFMGILKRDFPNKK